MRACARQVFDTERVQKARAFGRALQTPRIGAFVALRTPNYYFEPPGGEWGQPPSLIQPPMPAPPCRPLAAVATAPMAAPATAPLDAAAVSAATADIAPADIAPADIASADIAAARAATIAAAIAAANIAVSEQLNIPLS